MATVPASVLAALGGLTEDDPPVRWVVTDDRAVFTGYEPVADMLLPASSAALRRALARHLGWTLGVDEVPPWLHVGAGIFSFGGKPGCDPVWYGAQPGNPIETVPTLDGVTDPMEALAAVLVHVADQAPTVTPGQCPKGCGFPLSDHRHGSDECPSITFTLTEDPP